MTISETEIVDLRDFPMPFFDEVASNAWAPSQDPVAQRWQKKVAGFDGYIFVTAEYNHGIPAVLKNALDYAYPEWNKKAAGFVGYGSAGRRARDRAFTSRCRRAAIGDHPHRRLTFRARTSWRCGRDGKESEGHHLPASRRQRHAGSEVVRMVDRRRSRPRAIEDQLAAAAASCRVGGVTHRTGDLCREHRNSRTRFRVIATTRSPTIFVRASKGDAI